MKHDNAQVNALAMTTNVALAAHLVERITDRTHGLEGMAVLSGPSGYGKTMAVANAANLSRGYFVTMRSVYSRKDILCNIAREVGVSDKGRLGQILDRIAEQMALSERPLFIDEVDYLMTQSKIELVRDLHDASQGSIVMIGEELLPTKLKKWERFYRRVMTWVRAEPVSRHDAEQLAPIYCPNVDLSDELYAHMLKSAGGSTGHVVTYMNNIKEYCATRRVTAPALGDLPDSVFDGHEAPRARSHLLGAA